MTSTKERKEEHLEISLSSNVESPKGHSGFQDVYLIHQALSDLDLSEINLETYFLGKKVGLPLLVASMTGGIGKSLEINENLAKVAEEFMMPIGVGSVRAGIEDASLAESFRIVKRIAPSVPVISNIGASQLSKYGVDVAIKAVDLIEADALAVHLNKLQELVMPEGEPSQKGVLKAISQCVEKLSVPLILKETGSGLSLEVAELSKSLGVKYVDVGGYGGTNFAIIEHMRASKTGHVQKADLGKAFYNWGIPTAISLVEALSVEGLRVIATGGLRSGLDAAKALALGAEIVGVGLPLLREANKGIDGLRRWVESFSESLKCTMFLTGSKNITDLKNAPVILGGFTGHWLQTRGIDINKFSRRRWRWN